MRASATMVLAMSLTACTKSTPEPASVPSTTAGASVAASTSASASTTALIMSASATTAVTGGVASADWTRDCPVDPDPSQNDALYGHGVARFVTPDRNTHDFKVEIARTEAAHERGLMFRTTLADDAGMVFVFPEPHHAIFWMKNTCVPLDMIFVGEDDKVIGVVTAPRLNVEGREVPGFSRYVVEIAAGRARALGIGLGTRFVAPAFP